MVASDDLEKIKKFPPRERLEKLRELEKKNKEEIEKAQQMMQDSERDIEFQKNLEDVEIPEIKSVNIRELFSDETSLEETVEQEAAQREITAKPQYDAALDEAKRLADTLVNAYGSIKQLVGEAYNGTISEDDAERLNAYSQAAQQIHDAGFNPSEDFQHVVGEADRLLYAAKKQLRGESTLRKDYIN